MSGVPVYEQLVEQIEKYIVSGILPAGSQLPSVRNLSVSLSINPNTVQKAFNDLTGRGVLVSVPGKGSFVTQQSQDIIRDKGKIKLYELRSLVRELKLFGIEKETIIEYIEREYNEKGGDSE